MDLGKIRRRLRRDLRSLKAPEGYLRAGSPRYATLFGRDSLISAWQALSIDPSIAAATLRILAAFQGRRVSAKAEEEPGKILHEHRFEEDGRKELPDWDFPYFGSADSTPLFLVLGERYVRTTDDQRLLEELWGAFSAAWRWIERYGDADGDGYVEYERKNPKGLFHQGWKDGSNDHLNIRPPVAMVEVQGYVVAAHRAYADLATRMGQSAKARDALGRAETVKKAVNRDFWMPDADFFALALDGAKRPRRAIASNPGHLLLSGAIDPSKVRAVVKRLFQEDLWTPYGIRTHATSEPDFNPYGYHLGTVWPHDNWFIYKGLQALGFWNEARRIRHALLRSHAELGRIPELYSVVNGRLHDLSKEPIGETQANPIQAWASAGLLDMLTQ